MFILSLVIHFSSTLLKETMPTLKLFLYEVRIVFHIYNYVLKNVFYISFLVNREEEYIWRHVGGMRAASTLSLSVTDVFYNTDVYV